MHVSNGIGVKFRLNLGRFFYDVKVLEEIIKPIHRALKVFNGDGTIRVEIESHPGVLDRDINSRVCFGDVLMNCLMFVGNNLDVAGDSATSLVIQEKHVFDEGSDLTIKIGVKFLSVRFH